MEPAPAAVNPATATDGFDAGLLAEASRRLGEISAELEHGVRTVTKFPCSSDGSTRRRVIPSRSGSCLASFGAPRPSPPSRS